MKNTNNQLLLDHFNKVQSHFRKNDYKKAREYISEIRKIVFEISCGFVDQKIPEDGIYDEIFMVMGAAHCYEGMIGFIQGDGNLCVMMHMQSIRFLDKVQKKTNEVLFLEMRSCIEIACRYSSDIRNEEKIKLYLDRFNSLCRQIDVMDNIPHNISVMCKERDRIYELYNG
ncbi:hypothetical protein [Armatimonas rosea]|uniref:Uncharacterized protein n=1 Tax=Armatimonas rosea TaxID=685828 RepID=A0A7W9W8Y2_ARMRO|nr:hypothetical protein [Armatimonas rosea]MBB6052620.1 hypothetical protein [Armatimonas rosea]